ncbi:MAG: PKD domain-containing protein [Bacteroidota bacterium]
MEKNQFSETFLIKLTVWFSNTNLSLFNTFILFIFATGLLAQNPIKTNISEKFDEKAVLQEFRKREGSELKYPKAYESFLSYKKQEFEGKKNGTWQKKSISGPPTLASGECGNIDFETGDLSDWTGSSGNNPGCCGTPGFVSNGVNAGVNDGNARHTIVSGVGLDPCGGFPVVAPPMPGYVQGTYSCRLGNAVAGNQAERLETVFTPSPTNNVFTYQYAVVLENPPHDPDDQPFFRVEILDGNGNPIPCTTITYIAGGDFTFENSTCVGVQYKPWATVSVDLVAHIGNPVTIRFTSADCTAGGHYGYGYVNTECSALVVTQQDSLCVGSSVTLSAPLEDNNTYSWTGPGGPYNGRVINVTQAGTYDVTMLSSTGCVKLISYVVVEYPTAFVNAIPDQTICNGETVALSGSVGGAATSGTWTGGTGVFTPNNTTLNCTYAPSAAEITAGTLTLTLTTNDPAGPCPAVSEQTIITIEPVATVTAGSDQTICNGNTVILGGSFGGSASNGSWSGGTGTFTPNNLSPGAVYTPAAAEVLAGTAALTFTTDDPAGACSSVNDQMIITINQLPTANAGSGQYVCTGATISLAGSVGGTATSGAWSGGGGSYSPNNTALNAIYTPSAAEYASDSIILTLTTNDPAGPCTPSLSNVKFHFYPLPVVDFSVDDPSGCPEHCVNFTDLTIIAGNDSITGWSWDFGEGNSYSSIKNPGNCFSDPGFYDIKLIATSNNGCTSTLIKPQMIEVFQVPVAEFSPDPANATVIDPSITMKNQSSSDVNYWHWDFGDGDTLAPSTASPLHLFPSEISASYLVTLIVHNANGCYDTIPHTVFIGPEFTFFIPNAFTPNGDGINDKFYGSGVGITEYDLWIFDRWGNTIFHGDDLDDQWNGKANSGDAVAQIDVYVWKVELTDVFKKVHTYLGTVTIAK